MAEELLLDAPQVQVPRTLRLWSSRPLLQLRRIHPKLLQLVLALGPMMVVISPARPSSCLRRHALRAMRLQAPAALARLLVV